MKLVSWNVNGIRAVHRKGFMDWFHALQPDILALQETRATEKQVPAEIREIEGYHKYWYPAQKLGYSGVGLLSKYEPLDVRYGLGLEHFDEEGRVLIAEYDDFVLFNTYFPSGTRGLSRVDFKMAFNAVFLEECERCRKQGSSIIFCGDVNIAHNEIDLTYPKANVKTSGFLPIERAWLDSVVELGYVDTFRHLYPDLAEQYTWWTARGTAREKNVGWRIDYFFVSQNLLPAVKNATIYPDVLGSDHCPISLELLFE